MTYKEFDEFLEEFLTRVRSTLKTKGAEYTRGNPDRFFNFKDQAARRKVSPLTVAAIFLDKHLAAIDSYITNGEMEMSEPIMSRFTDAVLYLILMAGMVSEGGKGPTLLRINEVRAALANAREAQQGRSDDRIKSNKYLRFDDGDEIAASENG